MAEASTLLFWSNDDESRTRYTNGVSLNTIPRCLPHTLVDRFSRHLLECMQYTSLRSLSVLYHQLSPLSVAGRCSEACPHTSHTRELYLVLPHLQQHIRPGCAWLEATGAAGHLLVGSCHDVLYHHRAPQERVQRYGAMQQELLPPGKFSLRHHPRARRRVLSVYQDY